MASTPLGKDVVAKTATPLLLTVWVPRSAVPLLKFMLPKVEPVGVGITVAVKVTRLPGEVLAGEAARSVVLAD